MYVHGQRGFKACSASFNQQSENLCRAFFFLPVDTERWKYKRHGTEGKRANGSLYTLGVRELVQKNTNAGLQRFFLS